MIHGRTVRSLLRYLNFVLVISFLLHGSLLPAPPVMAETTIETLPLPSTITESNPATNLHSAPDQSDAQSALLRPFSAPTNFQSSTSNELTIARNGANLALAWSFTSASTGYELHRGSSPLFIPSAATLLQTLPAGTTTYTDVGAAGDPAVNHFYIVQAINGDERLNSNTVGEIDYPLNNTGDNYTLLALPFASPLVTDAATLAAYIGGVAALLKWNPATQTFRIFTPPASGDNFALTTGDVLFVRIQSGGPTVVTMTGAVTPTQYNLTPNGYHFVALPLQQGGASSASVVAAEMPAAQSLLAWNEATQLFRLFTPPNGGDNFTLTPGSPFVVQMAGSSAQPWPALLPPLLTPPDLDQTVETNLYNATTFLYTGANPVQTGMQSTTIEVVRAAVVRGRVLDRAGNALPGVTITIVDQPAFGQTISRLDGRFDMAINGGGLYTVNYAKTGYLPVHRQIEVPWQEYALLPDVVMIPLDTRVTAVNLVNPTAMQVVRGSVIADADGTRQETLLVPPGTQATMTLANGATQPLTTLHVRATEYTVGDNGPQAMPAELPPNSAYTYATEFTVDEADAAGATIVNFSQPLIAYNENFLNFPVGTGIPMGYYDHEKALWVASDSGRVIKILSVTAGLVNLDTDGNGQAESAATLTSLGITDAERATLATLYTVGQSLWRTLVYHFSDWDKNMGTSCQQPCSAPGLTPTLEEYLAQGTCTQPGSIIECQNQVLGETIGVAGTPFTLNYRSDRTPARKERYTINIPVSGPTLSPNLQLITLEISVGGRLFKQAFYPIPNQRYTFTWDGKDVYGRVMQGRQTVYINVGYLYPLVYARTDRFGYNGNGNVSVGGSVINGRAQFFILWQRWKDKIGAWDIRSAGLGGWSFDAHHTYSPGSRILYMGDGSQRQVKSTGLVVSRISTSDIQGGISAAADGSIYFPSGQRVYRRARNGTTTVIAGTGTAGYNGNGIQATSAMLNNPRDVRVAPDGSIYIADSSNNRVRRVGTDGIITTVAGTGGCNYTADGGRATQAQICNPTAIALGPDGSLYIRHVHTTSNSTTYLRRVGTDGLLTTIVGGRFGSPTCSGDGGLASQAYLTGIFDIDITPDGTIYLSTACNGYRIKKITTNGIISTIAGGGSCGNAVNCGDGDFATNAVIANIISDVFSVDAADDGSILIGVATCVRQISPGGIINTIAGDCETFGDTAHGLLALQARFNSIKKAIIGSDNNLYIGRDLELYRVSQPLPGLSISEALIPSEDGSELYVFDAAGRHLRTLHALTNAILYQFGYDSAGRLASITDGDGNITTVERNGSGQPTAIVAPFGQRTTINLDANGYLTQVIDPNGHSINLTSTTDGLLTQMTDPRGSTYQFTYDALGRLTLDSNPAGGYKALTRLTAGNSYTVSLGTALGRETRYRVDNQTTGNLRLTNRFPDNSVGQTQIRLDGSSSTTQADGSTATSLDGPDPRWGMQAPVAQSGSLKTPANRTVNYSTARTVTLSNNSNPLSLTALTENFTVNGKLYSSVYNASTRTFTDKTPLNRQSTTKIDAQGRVIQEQVTGLLAANYSYDSVGRLSTATVGTGAEARTLTYAYNSQGYVQSITDPLGRSVTFAYDAAGRVTSQTLPGNRTITFAYDANGNLTALTPPGRPAHTFTYTPVDLTSAYQPPNVGGASETRYDYNLDQQVTRVSRPDGKLIDFAYDSAGRLTTLTTPRGVESYSYHPSRGLLTAINAPGGVNLAYGYDGSLLTNVAWRGPISGSVAYGYDNDLRLTSLTVNNTPAVVYQYDNDSLLTRAGDLVLSRNAQNGLLTGTTLGNVADTWSYNGFGEVTTYRATYGGSELFKSAYNYDKLGRIITKTETISGVVALYGYSYDAAGRLAAVYKDRVLQASYSYDLNGNRLSYTTPTSTLTGSYDDQDRLLQYGDTTYTYSANGELTSKTTAGQTTTYDYDVHSNLIYVSQPDGTVIEYVIDGQNRRIGKKLNGVLVQGFLYQDQLEPVAELDGNGAIVSRFIYGARGHVPDTMIKAGVTYRIVSDHLGSVRLVINTQTGQVAQRMKYDEFGQVIEDTSPGFQPFGFAGGVADRNTGLVRFGARDYDTIVGRWVIKDPIEFLGESTNLYTYVKNDPLNLIDPTGLQCKGLWENIKNRWFQTHEFMPGVIGSLVSMNIDKGKGTGLRVAGFMTLKWLVGKGGLANVTSGPGTMAGLGGIWRGGKFLRGFVFSGTSSAIIRTAAIQTIKRFSIATTVAWIGWEVGVGFGSLVGGLYDTLYNKWVDTNSSCACQK